MASASRTPASTGLGEIIPTALFFKNLPFTWKSTDLLNLMSEMNLPSPSAMNFLYNDFNTFRGMAFANFASPNEASSVIRALHYYRACGRSMKVQYKRKRPDNGVTDDIYYPRMSVLTDSFHTFVAEKRKAQSQAEVSPKLPPTTLYKTPDPAHTPNKRTRREPTPPSQSYYLLMSYQRDPAEKEKLRKFLAQTGGDYQEAVNEFAKNRARETQERWHGKITKDRPVLERRSPSPGEEEQIAEIEARFGYGRRADWTELLVTQRQQGDEASIGRQAKLSENVRLPSSEREHESAGVKKGLNQDARKGGEGTG